MLTHAAAADPLPLPHYAANVAGLHHDRTFPGCQQSREPHALSCARETHYAASPAAGLVRGDNLGAAAINRSAQPQGLGRLLCRVRVQVVVPCMAVTKEQGVRREKLIEASS